MKKEKDYTFTVEVHVSREEELNAKRYYTIKVLEHPFSSEDKVQECTVSNMNDAQTQKVGKTLLDAIWNTVAVKDTKFWGI